jgi:hypothetical protein
MVLEDRGELFIGKASDGLVDGDKGIINRCEYL